MRIETLFAAITGTSVRHPRKVLAAAAIAVAAALTFAAGHLTLATSNLDLIDPDLPTVARFRAFAAEFGTPNMLCVVLEAVAEDAALGAAVDRLRPLLQQATGARTVIDAPPIDRDATQILGLETHLLSHDGGLAFLFVQPDDAESQAETIAPFVAAARQALAAADLESLGVRGGLTGLPAYALDDREIIERDIARLSLISLVLLLLLFTTAFGALRRPLLAVLTVVIAVAVTLGVIAVYPGHLTLLSAFFASILFGLGIDFGIHLIDRIEEGIAAGRTQEQALPAATTALARSLATSALTTSSVLFALQLGGFRGFAELGMVAGIGLLLCLLAMLTVLPALLMLLAAPPAGERRLEERRIGRLLAALQSRPLAWLLIVAALASTLWGGPGFDGDYLALQPADSETVRLEREMVSRSDWSPAFAAFTVDSRAAVKELVWQLVQEEGLARVSSLRDLEPLPGLAVAAPAATDMRRSFVSPRGRFAVYAYPEGDVWDPETQEAFIARMRAIDPDVTGMPFLGSFMVARSKHALRVCAAVGGVLLLFWVWLDFRRFLPVVLAVLPTALAVVAMQALMRAFGIAWNPLAIMALPIVLGIAVDDGVHMVHRFLAEDGHLRRTLAGSGRSIVLTSATTLAAFATLAFTPHRGLASFALALSFGVAAALLFSVLVLPQLLVAMAPRLGLAGGLADGARRREELSEAPADAERWQRTTP